MAQATENIPHWRHRGRVSYQINTMAGDVPATQGARASSAMALIFPEYSEFGARWVDRLQVYTQLHLQLHL